MLDGVSAAAIRLRIDVSGVVQGVGFRPFVFRLAAELGLAGFVCNAPSGVVIEAEGPADAVQDFADRLRRDAPNPARITGLTQSPAAVRGVAGFAVVDSLQTGGGGGLPLADLATCADCRADIFARRGRHAGYAFTACAVCGPRFSVLDDLPYDRERTTLAGFPLCPDCLRGYGDPADRRFHAETQACAVCGPALSLVLPDVVATPTPSLPDLIRQSPSTQRTEELGQFIRAEPDCRIKSGNDEFSAEIIPPQSPAKAAPITAAEAVRQAASLLRGGGIVAVKGVGGFHLLACASDADAVAELRARKHRPAQPFAVLFASLAEASAWCAIGPAEAALLTSAAAPIVLVPRGPRYAAADGVAPGNPRLGVMLAYAPLHHLLLAEVGQPLVATSANISGAPLAYRDADLSPGLAEAVLTHNRPIRRPVEDSVAQVVNGAPMLLRLGRGYAPLAVDLAAAAPPILALGGHLKNAPGVTLGRIALLGPQLGDLDHPGTLAAHRDLAADLCRLPRVQPQAVACDAHPDDVADAQAHGLPVVAVQHHLAHVAAAMAEHRLPGPVLGIAWDGAGYGSDGTIWGGEFLLVDAAAWRRVARLRRFRLPGGDAAAREPPRAAAGVLAELLGGEAAAPLVEDVRWLALCRTAPQTSSAGRLIDAVAALLGLCRRNSFEGEAAMALEHCAGSAASHGYRFAVTPGDPAELDWAPALRALLADREAGVAKGLIAARLYRGLIDGAVAMARHAGVADVVLTGGCFQSPLLAGTLQTALAARGHRVHVPQRVPPGDGGLALGQLEWARRCMAIE